MTSAVMAVAAVSAGISAANSAAGAASAFDGRRADWVDRAVPRRAEVVVLWYQGSETRLQTLDAWVMVTEFFNRSIGDVYRIGRPTYYDEFLPTVPVAVDDDGVVTFRGKPVVNRFVVTTCKTPIDGRPIAAAPSAWLQLVEVNGVVRLTGRPRCKTGVW